MQVFGQQMPNYLHF